MISSTSRYGRTVAELQAAWLGEHAVGGHVIIDDHSDMGELRAIEILMRLSRP
ncbi:MAG: hypothetical protein ACREKG_13450 [Candidatus Rokuibacteriota bacterium]